MPGLVDSNPAPPEPQEKKPLKPCCACPETKKARDAWSVCSRSGRGRRASGRGLCLPVPLPYALCPLPFSFPSYPLLFPASYPPPRPFFPLPASSPLSPPDCGALEIITGPRRFPGRLSVDLSGGLVPGSDEERGEPLASTTHSFLQINVF